MVGGMVGRWVSGRWLIGRWSVDLIKPFCHSMKWFQLNHTQFKAICTFSNELFSLGEPYVMKPGG